MISKINTIFYQEHNTENENTKFLRRPIRSIHSCRPSDERDQVLHHFIPVILTTILCLNLCPLQLCRILLFLELQLKPFELNL